MSAVKPDTAKAAQLAALPGDDVRQIMWRFADRYDLQMLVQSVRAVARGPVARLVAGGARNTHEWSEEKNSLLEAYDSAGITSVFLEPEYGGFIAGPKNLALALAAFELAWVDGGAATGAMAGHLGLSPIHEKGTPEQKEEYMRRFSPPQPGEDRTIERSAFALTEPIPYVGVDTGVLGGKVSVKEWKEGEEPILHVEKRGRFITNMAFANFVSAAVDSGDERIKGSCMIILEENDPGIYDRGTPTKKLVHQLSATSDPVFSLDVPASRIIGGYTVKDGVIIPNHSHGGIIDSVFRRTRVTVGLMTAAKLLSAVEPVVRYHRGRFRGGESDQPGSPRHQLGLQQKQDTLHRLVDIWATGEASAALGFAAARLFDELDPLDHRRDEIYAAHDIPDGRRAIRALESWVDKAVEYVRLAAKPEGERDQARFSELEANELVQYLVKNALADVLCPAGKLWNTGHGANMMREAVSLMGGYGITEDCPGFLPQKWMDAQLEATYEGPEAVQRRQLSVTMTNEVFLAQFEEWITEMRHVAGLRPGSGACTLASAMDLWLWTLRHLLEATDADGAPLYKGHRQGVTFPMADALCWLLASRYQIMDLIELEEKGSENASLAEALPGYVAFFTDLCHVQAAAAGGEVARICSSLVFGYNRHPCWTTDGDRVYSDSELTVLENVMPGLCSCIVDVLDEDGAPPVKRGPCVRFDGYEPFTLRRGKLDGCLTGSRLAKDNAALALTRVTIPEALDYPL
ncbi:MAG: acyl-CoA dehydrogenase [Gemmatimonadetes bacterium]|nr:acyl-CoA dehydrogenase [Gemmatimonadota bacterium]NIO30202.1 acyl-CoA dehydrogenase [Gemmatimonadota bacterium]